MGLGISFVNSYYCLRTGDRYSVFANSADMFRGGRLDLVPVMSLLLSLDLLLPLLMLAFKSSSLVGEGDLDYFVLEF